MSNLAKSERLTRDERNMLESCERCINEAARSLWSAGQSMLRIRDLRLYRETHSNFDDYCRERFGFTSIHVNRLIKASHVLNNLKPIGFNSEPDLKPIGFTPALPAPESEWQVRPLTRLPETKQKEAWKKAVEAAGGAQPTAKQVENAAAEIASRPKAPAPAPAKAEDKGEEVAAMHRMAGECARDALGIFVRIQRIRSAGARRAGFAQVVAWLRENGVI
jgi:hypothetical protein